MLEQQLVIASELLFLDKMALRWKLTKKGQSLFG